MFRMLVMLSLFSSLIAGCAQVPAKLSSTTQRALDKQVLLDVDNDALVYTGEVFTLQGEKVYLYQRSTWPRGQNIASTHTTYDLEGKPLLVQTAVHNKDYALLAFSSIDSLTGVVGTMKVSPSGQDFMVNHGGHEKNRHEKSSLPLVAGPTLFGFVRQHWDALNQRKPIDIAFVLPDRGRTMAFRLSREGEYEGKTTITMQAINPLYRLFIKSMRIVYDSESLKPLQYTGRVPPVLITEGRQIPFDALIEYHYAGKHYR